MRFRRKKAEHTLPDVASNEMPDLRCGGCPQNAGKQFFYRPSMPKKFLLLLFVRVKKNASRLKKRLALDLMAV